MSLRKLLLFLSTGLLLGMAVPSWASVDFTQEPVTIPVKGTQLKGEWMLPSARPRGVAVILQGSGNVGMDGDVSSPIIGFPYQGQKAELSKQLAETLASQGIASLRYDKRGFNDPAQLPNQTLPYMVSDANSAMSFAEARFPGLKSAFVGLSEGALVAVIAASEEPVNELYLFSLPTRSIDEMFHYQYVEWPISVLSRLDQMPLDGELTAQELAPLGTDGELPLLTLFMSPADASWKALDPGHTGEVSISSQLVPTYDKAYAAVLSLMKTPAFSNWYNGFKVKLASFPDAAGKISSPVHLYQSIADAQLNWAWVDEDKSDFAGLTHIRYFGKGLGHCFSPMQGSIGQTKTSGPIDNSVLSAFAQDLGSF